MTDTTAGDSAPNGSDAANLEAPGMRVLAQYIKDLSFESPNAPDSLRGPIQPQIDLGIELNAQGREDQMYEVELKLTAKASRDNQAVFIIELAYAGLFQINGVAPADIEPILMIECPRYLFPFARRIIADLSTEGGFPPFMLEPIDFGGVYAARRAQTDGQPSGNA